MGELGLLQAARRLAKASTNGVQSMWCKVLPCIHQGLAYSLCICKDSHQKPSPSVSACMSHPCCVQRKGQCGRQLPCQEYRSHTESHESQQCVLRIRQVMSEISGPIHFCQRLLDCCPPCTALNPVCALPTPSTVITEAPSRLPTGQRQELMHLVWIFPATASCTVRAGKLIAPMLTILPSAHPFCYQRCALAQNKHHIHLPRNRSWCPAAKE